MSNRSLQLLKTKVESLPEKMKFYIGVALFLCTVTANKMEFDYQIKEGKSRYVENIETDLGKDIVKMHTPAHNDVLESYTMQDFRQGLEITCIPSLKECRLRKIDTDIAVHPGQITEAFLRGWNQGSNSISSDEAKVITELYYMTGEVTDTVSLGEDLRRFYEEFEYPLYHETKVPKGSQVLKITDKKGSRFKRALNWLTLEKCNGKTPKQIFAVDSGKRCNHYRYCGDTIKKGNFLADCGSVHITSPTVVICLCCPWVTEIMNYLDICECKRMDGRPLGNH